MEHVAIGSSHTVALSSTGQLYSWGWGERGQLGQGLPGSFHASLATGHDPRDTRRFVAGGDRTTESTRARKLQLAYDVSFKPPASFKGGNSIRVVSVACGDNHTIVLTSNRVVFTWGVGDSGQLGHASTANEWAPRQLLSLNGRGVCRVRAAHAMLGACQRRANSSLFVCMTQVAAGAACSFAVTTRGSVLSWGTGAMLGHDAVKEQIGTASMRAARSDPEYARIMEALRRSREQGQAGLNPDFMKIVGSWTKGLRATKDQPTLTTATDRRPRAAPAAMQRLKELAAAVLQDREPCDRYHRYVVLLDTGVWR